MQFEVVYDTGSSDILIFVLIHPGQYKLPVDLVDPNNLQGEMCLRIKSHLSYPTVSSYLFGC